MTINDWDDNSNNMVTFDPAMPPVLDDGDYPVRRLGVWTPANVNAALENSAYARPEMNSSDQRKVDSLRAEVLQLIEENRLLEDDYNGKTSNRAIIQDLEQARKTMLEIIELRKAVLADIRSGGVL